ncbi:hypothetical protein AgCh_009830 [Apium graveolens]
MYPTINCEDASLFLFSDKITANSISTNEGFSSSSLFNRFPCSPLINYDDAPVFYQHLYNMIDQNGDQQVVTNETREGNNLVESTDDKFCGKSGTADKKESSFEDANINSPQIRKNRRCKKDRHSKIVTGNGSSRGRRMRLSIDVAKDFFALQDMLRFDKPSKTVEWLIKKSENAIKEVKKQWVVRTKQSHNPSSTSVLSADELEAEVARKEKIIREKGSQKLAALHPFTRESREKARARARETTQEKKKVQLVGAFADVQHKLINISQEINYGSHCNPLLGCQKSEAAGNNILSRNPSDPALVLEKMPNYNKQQSQDFERSISGGLAIDDSLFITNNLNP